MRKLLVVGVFCLLPSLASAQPLASQIPLLVSPPPPLSVSLSQLAIPLGAYQPVILVAPRIDVTVQVFRLESVYTPMAGYPLMPLLTWPDCLSLPSPLSAWRSYTSLPSVLLVR